MIRTGAPFRRRGHHRHGRRVPRHRRRMGGQELPPEQAWSVCRSGRRIVAVRFLIPDELLRRRRVSAYQFPDPACKPEARRSDPFPSASSPARTGEPDMKTNRRSAVPGPPAPSDPGERAHDVRAPPQNGPRSDRVPPGVGRHPRRVGDVRPLKGTRLAIMPLRRSGRARPSPRLLSAPMLRYLHPGPRAGMVGAPSFQEPIHGKAEQAKERDEEASPDVGPRSRTRDGCAGRSFQASRIAFAGGFAGRDRIARAVHRAVDLVPASFGGKCVYHALGGLAILTAIGFRVMPQFGSVILYPDAADPELAYAINSESPGGWHAESSMPGSSRRKGFSSTSRPATGRRWSMGSTWPVSPPNKRPAMPRPAPFAGEMTNDLMLEPAAARLSLVRMECHAGPCQVPAQSRVDSLGKG